jgi:hypothetical protein
MAKKNKPGKDAKKDDKKDVKAKVKKGAGKKPVVKKAAAPKAVPAKKAAPAKKVAAVKKAAPAKKAAAVKKAAPAKKAAAVKKAAPARKAPLAKKAAPAKRATRGAGSPPAEPYWLNARIEPLGEAEAGAATPALKVTVLGPPAPATAALAAQTLAEFGSGARKIRLTLTLSADPTERQAQWADLHAKLQSFLGTYATVQGYCATCQSNPDTACPDES